MRKSILRFGALALMSLMSINSWAQLNVGDPFEDGKGNSYLVVTKFTPAQGQTAAVQGEAQLISLADIDANVVDLGSVTPEANTVGIVSGESYKITEVGPSAAVRVTTHNVTVTIPNDLEVNLNIAAFANQNVTVKLKDGKLHPNTKIRANAFKNAKVTTTKDDNFLDFSNRELPANAFYDVNFEEGTTIYMGEQELSEGVFGASIAKNDIQTVQFRLDSKITTVPAKAFMKRTGLNNFGYNDGSFLLPTGLKKIGDYAFEGTSLTQFKFSDRDEDSKIEEVGKYAFSGCTWMTNDVFENVFKSFKGLTYKEGSFKDCGLTSIDLSNSGVNPIPAYAFCGNDLKNSGSGESMIPGLVLPTGCTSIGDYAFANNENLQVPALPAALENIGSHAFARTNISLVNTKPLYLPKNLDNVGKYAFSNRTLDVYANPSPEKYPTRIEPTGAETKTETINLYVPAKAPFKVGDWASNKNNVEAYKAYGWETSTTESSNIKYAQTFVTTGTETSTYYTYTDNENGVTYKTAGTGIDTNGCFEVQVSAFSKATPEVIGYIEVPGSKLIGSNKKEYTLKNGEYTYPLVLKVTGFDNGLTLVYEGTGQSEKNITGITFSPKNANVESGIVAELKATAAYTTIPVSPFSAQSITSITMNDGITTVAEGAFNGTKVTEITLPATLQSLTYTAPSGTATFPSTLETVKVSYNKAGATNTIPALTAGVFSTTKHLEIVEGGTATREDYLAKDDGWSKFFDNVITVNVKKDGETNPTRLATKDKQVSTGGVTTWKPYYELVDAGNTSAITSVSISDVSEGTKIPVKYVRDFSEAGVNKFQCWYVPFEYTHIADDGCTFYYIYDTKQIGEGADATTSIELKEVKLTEGKATIKANLPYVVKPSVRNVTFEADAISNTPETAGALSFTNVVNKYTFTGTYEKKVGNDTNPFYSLYASDGALHPFKANGYIWAYRFYLNITKRDGTGENPYGLVKFVVLDDEDATSIEDVKANSLNAPMFDLMGRQITSPAKGQVYIQNGVKKLAK